MLETCFSNATNHYTCQDLWTDLFMLTVGPLMVWQMRSLDRYNRYVSVYFSCLGRGKEMNELDKPFWYTSVSAMYILCCQVAKYQHYKLAAFLHWKVLTAQSYAELQPNPIQKKQHPCWRRPQHRLCCILWGSLECWWAHLGSEHLSPYTRVSLDLCLLNCWCKSMLPYVSRFGPGRGIGYGVYCYHQSCSPLVVASCHIPPLPSHHLSAAQQGAFLLQRLTQPALRPAGWYRPFCQHN